MLPTEIGFLSAVAAIGAGEWEKTELDELIMKAFGLGKKTSLQQARENAAAYQNKLEVFVKDNEE